MKRIIYIVFLLLGLIPMLHSQKDSVSVENMKMKVYENQVIINYDLVAPKISQGQEVFLKFYTENHQLVSPTSISGDIGSSVKPGENKTIIWDITKDMNSLPGKYYPKVVLNYDQYVNSHRGGPKNAFLSLLVPGLGDYFVMDPAEMKIPPYVRTICSWGFIATAIVAKNYRHHAPGEWKTYVHTQPSWGRTYTTEVKEYYEEGPMEYYLFKGDAEVFMIAGAFIWVYDILWVSAKGQANEMLKKSLNQELSLVPVQGGMGLSYRFTF